ncbi:hypothetical protein SAMN02745133_02260 [Desulforamulus putei DSM 12395]|uniref:Uncharacterized protein n=1 Tax=Desulforamulus putei DSM 12395 TaxID=1121429 RepID=A0A1M5AEY9_9FIRM|nr:hypothetical protein [Desulforamulus putei]SHF28831.1 hypothetical protein SAMN02745133_02260 [Desulforamulus putei DSM 12395]
MLVVFITRIKHKILKGLRFALVLMILAILLSQLAGLLKAAGFYTEEKIPSGNPMKVMAPVSEACDDENEYGILEHLIEQLLKYKHGEK